MRKLTKTLVVMSLLAPASAYSLGIGNIKVHSGLNQNLNAEISLTASVSEDVSDIHVSLAPPAQFDKAKVPWSFFLSKIKFEPVVKPNGTTVIKVTSSEALKEPFLDFLLEVSWPKGNLYRQFTVLLEPPAEYQKAAVSASPVYENYDAEPVVVEPQPRYKANVNTAATKSRPRRHVVHIDRSHNVTHKNDTLWKIAERNMNGNVPSVEQMMIAIYEANPQAFYKNNINALLPNKNLKIPRKGDAVKLSQNQALAEFNQHMRAWKNNTPDASREEREPPEADEKTVDKQLTLIAPTDAPVADDAATSMPNESTKADDKASDTKPKVGDANGRDGASKTDVSVVGSGQDEKTEKMLELEKQLASMQKNLALKEQQLQSLQNGGKALPAAAPETQTPANEIAVPSPVIKTPPTPKPPAAVVNPATKTQNPLVETPEPDLTYVWVAAIGSGLLSLIGWVWWRKRKFEDQFDGESMFAPSSMIAPPNANTQAANPVNQEKNTQSVSTSAATEENSFLNEFTASDFEVFDSSHVEIDPISETDVYLAYGRYQQAEELMRQAIKDQPDNDEYKLKLLEIFCATERKKDFVNYATELADAGKKDQAEFWAKVVEMGDEVWSDLALAKGGNLFTPEHETAVENIYTHLTSPETPDHVAVLDENNENTDETNFDVATFDTAFEESLLDSNTDSFLQDNANEVINLEKPQIADETFDEFQNNESIDFDLSSLSLNKQNDDLTIIDPQEEHASQHYSPPKKEFTLENSDEVEVIDFNPERDDIKTFDEFNLDSFTDDDDYSELRLTPETPSFAKIDIDTKDRDTTNDLDFDFDLAAPETESTLHYFDENDAGFDFMDLDELETKLDLAKAYIDMGDSDAAKEIIAEVLDKGNPEQIKVARNLFDSLLQ